MYVIKILVDIHIYNANKDIYSDDFGIQWIVAKMERCTSLWILSYRMMAWHFENPWPFVSGINHLDIERPVMQSPDFWFVSGLKQLFNK